MGERSVSARAVLTVYWRAVLVAARRCRRTVHHGTASTYKVWLPRTVCTCRPKSLKRDKRGGPFHWSPVSRDAIVRPSEDWPDVPTHGGGPMAWSMVVAARGGGGGGGQGRKDPRDLPCLAWLTDILAPLRHYVTRPGSD